MHCFNYLGNGAGTGNRTQVASLEGWNFTIKLHPQESKVKRFNLRKNKNQFFY